MQQCKAKNNDFSRLEVHFFYLILLLSFLNGNYQIFPIKKHESTVTEGITATECHPQRMASNGLI